MQEAVLADAQAVGQLTGKIDVAQLVQRVRIAAQGEGHAAVAGDGEHPLVAAHQIRVVPFARKAGAVELDGGAVFAGGEEAMGEGVVGDAVGDGLDVLRRAADGREGVGDRRGEIAGDEVEEALDEVIRHLPVGHAVAGQHQPHHMDVGVRHQHIVQLVAVRAR